jgi:glycosyltransferase involved in cell wall biosynthesis/LmbE family N-acetylglucosaminyl deacetylase
MARILHTIPDPGWAGREERILETALWQLSQNNDVFIAAPSGNDLHNRAAAIGVKVLQFKADAFLTAAASLRDIVARYQIDVIDCHGWCDLRAATLASSTLPLVHTLHHTREDDFVEKNRFIWQRVDHVITVAHAIQRALTARSVVEPERLSVAGEWALPHFFQVPDQRLIDCVRSRLRIDPRRPVVAMVSMLRPEKGVEILLRAVAVALMSVPNLQVLVVGGARAAFGDNCLEVQQLKVLGNSLGIAECLLTTGFRDDVHVLMRCADLLIVPSLREAQSRVIPQAFASRLPVIASAVGGIPELITDGITGWLVPPNEPAELARRIVSCVRAPIARAEVAHRAERFAHERLGQDLSMQATMVAYETARNRRNAASAKSVERLTLQIRREHEALHPLAGLHVMLVVAHPDDETLGAGGSFCDFGRLTIVYVTDGAPNSKLSRKRGFATRAAYARARMEEARRGLSLVTLETTFVCLEVQDQRAALSMAEIAFRLYALFVEFTPDVILTHAFEGGHPDHDATAFAVHAAQQMMDKQIPTVEITGYHNANGSEVFGSFVLRNDAQPVTVFLSAEARTRKKAMLDMFVTQKNMVSCFPIEFESFRLAPRYDFSKRPHDGKLYYENQSFSMTWGLWLRLVRRAKRSFECGSPGARSWDWLVITGPDRYRQARSQMELLEKEVKTLEACYAEANAQRTQLLQSTSWRATAPLRAVATVFRKYQARIFMLMTSIASKARTLAPNRRSWGSAAEPATAPRREGASETQDLTSEAKSLDRHAIIEGFARSLENGKKYAEPFLHYQFRPFCDGLYANILKQLPEDRYYVQLRHRDAIRPDGSSSRLVLPLQKGMISKLNPEQRDFWSELCAVMCAQELRDIFKSVLEPELRRRFNCSLDEVPAIPKLMLMRDFASYKIGIHPDVEWKTVTTQYYLPFDDSQRHLGTAIYMRQPDGRFIQTHKMDFLPGNAYCFAVSDRSWHAVEPIAKLSHPRDSMMLVYFRDHEHDY